MIPTSPVPRLSAHFTAAELMCPCCGHIQAGARLRLLLNALEIIRSQTCRPVRIFSGYRCPSHNRKVGGAPASKHLYGEAADLAVDGFTPAQLARLVKDCCPDVKGIGVGATKFHIDVREGPLVEWIYR